MLTGAVVTWFVTGFPDLTTEGEVPHGSSDHDFNEQELELKTNTELTREIDRLTTELHRRLIDHRTQQEK